MITEPVIEIDDIQGNIFPGFKKDNQTFLFFRVGEAQKARGFLAELSNRVTSSRQVLLAHALWKDMRARLGHEPTDFQIVLLNVAISRAGLVDLGWVDGLDDFDDDGFLLGLEARAGLVGDPMAAGEQGSPSTWVFGAKENPVHILVVMASDDGAWLEREVAGVIDQAEASGLVLIHQDKGKVLPGVLAGHEIFGFKDGVSEPAMRGIFPESDQYLVKRDFPKTAEFETLQERFASPGRMLVWPGQFLFGYSQQDKDKPLMAGAMTEGPDWSKNGSFLVYRRLRQDRSAFKTFVNDTAISLAVDMPTATPEWVGSRLVGRWKDGTPIMRQPEEGHSISSPGDNYFGFSTAATLALPGDTALLSVSDPIGARCPFAAHIRKINPRDDVTDLGGASRSIPKLILRRGITYDNTAAQDHDEGLIFISYQTSIVDQFEFLMNDWAVKEDRPIAGAGFDPILGATSGRFMNMLVEGVPRRIEFPSRFVFASGGEYFFAPSISCLKAISTI